MAPRSMWISDLDREETDHYAAQHHLVGRITNNISAAVFGYVVDLGQQKDASGISIVEPTDGDLAGSTDELLMPLWAYRTAAIYLFFISILGLLMNVVVVIVILNDPQKTPLNWMLLNLACSDGTIAGFGTPISTVAALQTGWHFNEELCVAYAMVMSTAGIGSITTLTVLALWRCTLVVCYPAHRTSSFTGSNGQFGCRQATLLLGLIWTYTLAVTCPPLFGWGRYDREASHISCSVNWESKMDNNRSYIFYLFGMGLILPLVVIIISYASILQVVHKTSEIKRKTLSTMQSTLSSHQHGHQVIMSSNQRVNANQSQPASTAPNDTAERRVTIMVACMIGAFMTAWTPYSIMALIETFGSGSDDGSHGDVTNKVFVGRISPGLATVPSLFAKTSAVLNPLIYGLLNTQFKSAWERLSLRFLRRHRRHHHHHHHRGHHQRHCSQDLLANANTMGNERRQMRIFHRQTQSPTVQLPMKEILPISSSACAMGTQQASEMVMPVTPSDEPPTEASLPLESHQKQDKKKKKTRNKSDHQLSSGSLLSSTTSSSSSSSFREMTRDDSNPNEIKKQNEEQPVSLVVVRLLSNSNGCLSKHATAASRHAE